MNKFFVWIEDWVEEEDFGVVVLDKFWLDVLMGFLYVVWQNIKEVCDEVMYKLMYGDKEIWWFGLELSGVIYVFEKYYGVMVGWLYVEQFENENENKVCSFYIGYVDVEDELFWYNGGFLRFKRGDQYEFGLFMYLMYDGKWYKNGNVEELSCMDQ